MTVFPKIPLAASLGFPKAEAAMNEGALPPPIPPPKTPLFVWIIGGYMIISAILSGASFLFVPTIIAFMPPPQKAYFAGLNSLDYALLAVGSGINIAAGALLLLRRRWAVPVMGIGLVFAIGIVIHQILDRNWWNAAGIAGVPGLLGAFVFRTAFIVYAARLAKSKILK